MDSFFHTYHIGGFVSTHEISRLLCELVTGKCTEWLRAAFVIRNSTPPEELAAAMNELSTSNDPQDRRLYVELQRTPIDENGLLYAESQVDQWDSAIRAAAKDNGWACADLRSFAPVAPSSVDGYCVRVVDVIQWIRDLKYPSILSEYLEVTLAISMKHHGESSDNEGDSGEAGLKQKKASPAEFCIAIEELLNEISTRAIKKGLQFSRLEMPGRKIDLQEIANKLDPRLKFTKTTFETYLKGLCRFKKGARETDFYRALFHDLI